MRAVVQRVREARVRVSDEIVGEIDRGILLLVGVTHEDTPADAAWLAKKVCSLRIFSDAAGKMNLALAEIGGAILVVSQFTLWGDCSAGRRPSYVRAAPGPVAEALYRQVVDGIRAEGMPAAEGRFGADMAVELVNDGPVTLLLDSKGGV